MDIRLPNGVVIRGVPEGTSADDVRNAAISAGLATEKDFGITAAPQNEAPADTSAVTGRILARRRVMTPEEREAENVAIRRNVTIPALQLGAGIAAAPAAGAAAGLLGLSRLAPIISSGGFAGTTGTGVGLLGQRALGGAIAGGAGGLAAETISPKESDFGGALTTGATVGAIVPGVAAPVVKQLAKGTGWLFDALSGKLGEVSAAKIARDVAGGDINAIKAANLAASQGDTAGQATAGIESSTWAALDNLAKTSNTGNWWTRRQSVQEAEINSALSRLAGGVTPTESLGVQGSAKSALTKITTPMREAELQAAGPIKTENIIQSLNAKLANPDIATNRDAAGALRRVASMLKEFADESGNISPEALYAIRKNGVSGAIADLNPGASDNTRRQLAQSVMVELKPLIDEAITNAGGANWANYLKTFEKGMKAIEQKQMSEYARNLYASGDKKGFVDLVKGNNPQAVEDIFGTGRFDFVKEMGGQRPKSPALEFIKIADKVEKEIKVSALAAEGRKPLAQIFSDNQSKLLGVPVPPFLSRPITVTREALKEFEGKVNRKTMMALENAMQSGQSANELLSLLPTAERNRVLMIMSNSNTWNPVVQRGITPAIMSDTEE
jgi:hypothetical protein